MNERINDIIKMDAKDKNVLRKVAKLAKKAVI